MMREDPAIIVDLIKLSDKARRLDVKYGYNLIYVQGKEEPLTKLFTLVTSALRSPQAPRAIAANANYKAAPIVGAGRPVLVIKLVATKIGTVW